jgi:hypothetical protein
LRTLAARGSYATRRAAKATGFPREVLMGAISALGGAALAASQVTQLITDVGFSTVVHGKTYTADVTYSNGEYVASDGNISGAVATGGSVQEAENNLTNRIDALV